MIKKLTLFALPLLLATGCTNIEPFEERIRQLTWENDANAAQAGQADVDKSAAESETAIGDAEKFENGPKLLRERKDEQRGRREQGEHAGGEDQIVGGSFKGFDEFENLQLRELAVANGRHG